MFGHRNKQEGDQQGLTPGQKFDLVDVATMPFMQHSGVLNWGLATFGALDVAISGAQAPRGQVASRMAAAGVATAASVAAYYAGGAVGAVVGQALIPIPGVGAWIGKTVGSLTAPFLMDAPVRHAVARTVQSATVWGQGHVNFGGFHDSQPAYTMRQRALQEMSGSLLNARQYLGKEAQLMHQ